MLKIFQAPLGLGSYNIGTEQAPEMLLREGLLEGCQKNSIALEVVEPLEPLEPAKPSEDLAKLHNASAVIGYNKKLRDQILQHTSGKDIALTLGGDHSIGIGTMLATKQRHSDACVVYIDAHPDCSNPKETLTGNIHGMPLSTALGDALYADFGGPHFDYQEVIIVGAKDIDAHEAAYLAQHDIRCVTLDTTIEQGIAAAVAAVQKLVGDRPLHVALDIDAVDYSEAPGTGIINQGGLSYREVSYLCRKLSTCNICAIDVVEVNPLRDKDDQTIHLANELAMSLLGGEWSKYTRYLAHH